MSVIDNAPLSRFHWRLAALSAGGPFLDGWILSIIGIALIQMTPALDMGALEIGLTGAAALAGMFFGGIAGGYVTDRIGRQLMYAIDLAVLVVGSVLSAFVTDAWQVIVLRFILGVAVGADYPIATSLLAEYLPRSRRGSLLGFLVVAWFVGSAAAYLVGYALSGLPNGWRWMLASAAVPGLIVVLLRIGTPESPRWLINKGRREEALAVVKRVFGEDADLSELPEEPAPTNIGKLFREGYLKRTLFVILFWSAQIIPLYAIYTYGPTILAELQLGQEIITYLGSFIISVVILLGAIPSMPLLNRLGRRPVLVWPFIPMALGLLLLSIPRASLAIVLVGFSLYAFFSGVGGLLVWVYPNELFPTDVRATAFGITTAFSLIAAAIFLTLVLPRAELAETEKPKGYLDAAFAGIREFRANRLLAAALLFCSFAYFGVFLYDALIALLVLELGFDATAFGISISVAGAAGLIGSLAAGALRTRRHLATMALAAIVSGAITVVLGSIATLGSTIPFGPYLVLMAVTAGSFAFMLVPYRTLIQEQAPPDRISRVFAAGEAVTMVVMMSAPFLGSLIATQFGTGSAFIAGGALMVFLGGVAIAQYLLRRPPL
jgi:MFS transporter, putative metabolite transport protein